MRSLPIDPYGETFVALWHKRVGVTTILVSSIPTRGNGFFNTRAQIQLRRLKFLYYNPII